MITFIPQSRTASNYLVLGTDLYNILTLTY
jgi:hypothetical protein